MGFGGSFSVVKRPRRYADNSPPSSAEVKKTWIYTSTPTRLYGIVLNCLGTMTTTCVINIDILYLGNNNADNISKVCDSLEGQVVLN
jgi:hypothetical protein